MRKRPVSQWAPRLSLKVCQYTGGQLLLLCHYRRLQLRHCVYFVQRSAGNVRQRESIPKVWDAFSQFPRFGTQLDAFPFSSIFSLVFAGVTTESARNASERAAGCGCRADNEGHRKKWRRAAEVEVGPKLVPAAAGDSQKKRTALARGPALLQGLTLFLITSKEVDEIRR